MADFNPQMEDSEYSLGLMYDKGYGVSKNYKKAARLYNKAAVQGYAPAQFMLGLLYARGHGLNQSNVKAYAWFVVSSGVSSSQELPELKEEGAEAKESDELRELSRRIRKIRKEMTPEQVEETKRLIQTYSKYRKKYKVLKLDAGGLSSEDKDLYFPEYFYQLIE